LEKNFKGGFENQHGFIHEQFFVFLILNDSRNHHFHLKTLRLDLFRFKNIFFKTSKPYKKMYG